MPPNKKRTYEVGYGRPSKDIHFQKGQSGNLRGRPKGSADVATILERVAAEFVPINENGRRRTISKLEASVM